MHHLKFEGVGILHWFVEETNVIHVFETEGSLVVLLY